MSYKIINPPAPLLFDKMSKSELKEYFSWFLEGRDARINILEQAVTNTSGFENWKADYSPPSLKKLGEWLAGEIETRPRSRSEIDELNRGLPGPINFGDSELTDKTFSLCFDIGTYLGEIFRIKFKGISWKQQFGSKKYVDYGQSTLTGIGKIPVNPIRLTTVFAHGVLDGSYTSNGLYELYEIYKEYI